MWTIFCLLYTSTAEAEGFWTVPEEQSLGGDDFSFYMEKVPGCYIKIGIGKGAVSYTHLDVYKRQFGRCAAESDI